LSGTFEATLLSGLLTRIRFDAIHWLNASVFLVEMACMSPDFGLAPENLKQLSSPANPVQATETSLAPWLWLENTLFMSQATFHGRVKKSVH
jgi:hypothetical protein